MISNVKKLNIFLVAVAILMLELVPILSGGSHLNVKNIYLNNGWLYKDKTNNYSYFEGIVNISGESSNFTFRLPDNSVPSNISAIISPYKGYVKNITAKIGTSTVWKFPNYLDFWGFKNTFNGYSNLTIDIPSGHIYSFNITIPKSYIREAYFNVHNIYSGDMDVKIGNLSLFNTSSDMHFDSPHKIITIGERSPISIVVNSTTLYLGGKFYDKLYVFKYNYTRGEYLLKSEINLDNRYTYGLVEFGNYLLVGSQGCLLSINKDNYTINQINLSSGNVVNIQAYSSLGKIFVSTSDKKIFVLNSSFDIEKVIATDEVITSFYVNFLNDTIVCGSFDGNIYIYSLNNNSLMWNVKLNWGIISGVFKINSYYVIVGRVGTIALLTYNEQFILENVTSLPADDILSSNIIYTSGSAFKLVLGGDYGKAYIFDCNIANNSFLFNKTKVYTIDRTVVCTPLSVDYDLDGDKDILLPISSGEVYSINNMTNWTNHGIYFREELQEYIDSINPTIDSYGNPLVNVPFTIFSNNPSKLILNALRIKYTAKQNMNITKFINFAQTNVVKIVFLGNGSGSIFVRVNVKYKICPPQIIYNIPTIEVYEDNFTSQSKIIDLLNYFWDDKPSTLQFYVYGGNENVTGYIEDGHYFSVRTNKNWFGNATFRIKAVDSDGLSTLSNPFNVTVLPVDDPPEIANIPPMRIHANTTHYLNLSGKVWDIDSSHIFINTSDPENVTPLSNLSLRIRYLQPGDYNPSIIVSDGNLTNSTTLNISVYPYSAPLFLKVPDVVTDKDVPITIENAKVNLRDYVDDPDTLPSQLNFTILNQSNPHISVSIEEGFVLVTPEEHYAGISYVIVKVDDGKYNDTTRFKVIVREKNYPPVYLGGLYDQTVYEDTTWRIDLSKHFDDYETPLGLVYSCNYPEIKIIGTIAEWTPRHGSKSLIGVIFTATDDVGQSANSTPINLQYVEVNDPPQYTGGLTNITMFDNQTLQLNLSNYFTDEEHPELLKFAASNQIVRIEGHVAIIEKPALGRYEVRFTAIDGENSSLKAYSPTITITVLPHNKKPVAYIDKAIVKGKTVFLVGHGYDPDGYIVKYEWYSSLDGYIGNASELTVTLSPGTHIIRFRVMDNNGTWSNYTEISVTIEEKGAFEIPRIVYGLLGGTLGLLAVVNLGRRLKFRKLKKEIFEGV